MKFYVTSILLISLSLVGCGESTDESTTTNTQVASSNSDSDNTSESNNTEEDAIEKEYVSPLPDSAPTYSVAMIAYEPFHFYNAHGGDVGYDVDMIRAIGEEAGFKVNITELSDQTFGGLLDEVNNGKYQIAMSGLSLTPERQEVMASSNPYSKGKPGYLVKADSKFKTASELDDVKVSVVEKSILKKILDEKSNADVVAKKTIFLSYQNVLIGESEAAFAMQPALLFNASQFTENPMRFIPFSAPIETAMYTSKENQKIIAKINEGLEKIKGNGKYHAINQKWFGQHAAEIETN